MVNVYIESLHGYSNDIFSCCYLIPRPISMLNCIVAAFLSFLPASLAEGPWANMDCPLRFLLRALRVAVVRDDRKDHG